MGAKSYICAHIHADDIMKRLPLLIGGALCLCGAALVLSCDDDDSYAEMKRRENAQIRSFLANGCCVVDEEMGDTLLYVPPINVISEDQFMANDSTTDVEQNQYVLFNNSGVYMQIVHEGVGEKLKNGETATIICRYTEFNIAGDSIQSTDQNIYYEAMPEVMTCTNTNGLFSASFTSGLMLSLYLSASVPSGWLTPLTYIRLGRKTAADEHIALVRLIVPSTEGTNDANTNVYACFYEISYMRSR